MLFSCNCGTIECSGFGADYDKYIPNVAISNIEYVNGKGDTISFQKYNSYKTKGGTIECPGKPLSGGCSGCDCELPSSSVSYFTNDSLRSNVNSGNTHIGTINYVCANKSQNTDSFFLSYFIYDGSNTVKVNPTNFVANLGDSILPSFSVGGKNYSNVLLHYNDTTRVVTPTYSQRKFIWKTYYVKEKGIVAFYDKLTNSLFYLN